MTIADVIEYAKYGELSQLGVVQNLNSDIVTEVVDAEKHIISYINLGLIELYKRFNLRTEEAVITLSPVTTLYSITDPNLSYIMSVYDEDGKEFPLNSETDPLSIMTPSYNTIQVLNPVAGSVVYVLYSAIPTKLVWADDLTTINVTLTPTMLEALLHYIGYRAHGAMNGNVDGENNTHYMRFESSCSRVKELGIVSADPLASYLKLESKGFV